MLSLHRTREQFPSIGSYLLIYISDLIIHICVHLSANVSSFLQCRPSVRFGVHTIYYVAAAARVGMHALPSTKLFPVWVPSEQVRRGVEGKETLPASMHNR